MIWCVHVHGAMHVCGERHHFSMVGEFVCLLTRVDDPWPSKSYVPFEDDVIFSVWLNFKDVHASSLLW